MTPGEQVWDDVAPRPLSADERAVLDHLATGLPAAVGLQLASARVIGCCRCGCSSIRLSTDGPAVTGADVAALSPYGPGGTVAVRSGIRGGGFVALRLVDGLLEELELYVDDGEAVPLPEVSSLRPVGPY